MILFQFKYLQLQFLSVMQIFAAQLAELVWTVYSILRCSRKKHIHLMRLLKLVWLNLYIFWINPMRKFKWVIYPRRFTYKMKINHMYFNKNIVCIVFFNYALYVKLSNKDQLIWCLERQNKAHQLSFLHINSTYMYTGFCHWKYAWIYWGILFSYILWKSKL